MHYDLVIIGAGASGLALTSTMQQRRPDLKIALLEAHSLPGGCASYFERQGYCFDAGATTLSGISHNRPLSQLFKELSLNFDLEQINPGLVSVIDGKQIHRYALKDKWLEELARYFPHIDHTQFWNKIHHYNQLGWRLQSHFKNAPLRDSEDVRSFLKQSLTFSPLSLIKALTALNQSLDTIMSAEMKKDPRYLALINELLFITAQNHSQDTPTLLAAMGLDYPEDTYYMMGGMKALGQGLLSKCTNVFFKNKVFKVQFKDDHFWLQSNRGEFKSRAVVSTLPLWNHLELFDDKTIQQKINKKIQKYLSDKECWGAFTMYFTIPRDSNRSSLYYQIHTSEEIPSCGTHSFFASLSHPNDLSRSPRDSHRQTVTISSHSKPLEWKRLARPDYLSQKNVAADFILKRFLETFDLQRGDVDHLLTGSPTTFMRYTHRHDGLVGGIPHSIRRNIMLEMLYPSDLAEHFYMIGDTQFPGQGIAAVVSGALQLSTHLARTL